MLEVRKFNISFSCLNPGTIATGMAIDMKLIDGNYERVMQPAISPNLLSCN